MPLSARLSFLPLRHRHHERNATIKEHKTTRKATRTRKNTPNSHSLTQTNDCAKKSKTIKTTQIYTIYIIILSFFFFFVIKNENAVTFFTAFTVLVCVICINNIIKLLLKICFFDIRAVLIAIVCGCAISAVYSVIKCVILLFLPLLFLLSFMLLCSLLIL